MKSRRRFSHALAALAAVLILVGNGLLAQDGPPGEFGPTDPHILSPTGLDQKVLVIYVQADDFRILPGDLVALNNTMNQRRNSVSPWFNETTYGALTVDMVPRRAAGDTWYTLPGTLLEYVRPTGASAMQARSAAAASLTNPTPPASVTASAGGMSGFAAGDAGNYFYAVSTFRNGVESRLTKTSAAVTVAANQTVTLTITRAADADADRYLVYRTGPGQPNADANFQRIGQLNVGGASDTFADAGIQPDRLGSWEHLIVDAMQAADPDVPDFDIFKGVLVVIFSPFLRGEAGAKTFTVNGSPINISGVYLASNEGFGRYTHEMGHWIGLPDLYNPVTSGTISTWDTMDCACDGQFHTWSKNFMLHYLTNPVVTPMACNVSTADVAARCRPAPGNPDLDEDFVIHPIEQRDTFAGRVTAVKVRASDTVSYYVEGRRHIAGATSDQNTPNRNIVVTETIDVLPAGIIPRRNVRLLTTLNAGDPLYKPVGTNGVADEAVEITFTSVNNPGGDESYNVHVKLKAQPQPDPRITNWSAPPWETPDVWVDSSREGGGFQDPATAVPLPDNGEHTWVNHENRVWARVTNAGQGAANNVTVKFKVNTPGGIGEAGQFVDLPTPPAFNLAPNETKMIFTTWTPTVGLHTCIKVEIDHVAGESDINNNFTQENVDDFYTGSASPWHLVNIPLDVANPLPEARRVDIEVAGLPPGWRAKVDKRWVMLDAKGRKPVQATIIPPPDAPECTKATLNLYGLIRIDDYTQPYSGFTPIVHLANPIKFRISVARTRENLSAGTTATAGSYVVQGCTIPAQPNSEIAIQLEGVGGETRVLFTRTDASGCFSRAVLPPHAGLWQVRAYFPGSDCKAPTESDPVKLPVPTGGGGDNFPGGGEGRSPWFSIHGGYNFPVGSFSNGYNPGPSVTLDSEFFLSRRVSLYAMLGYHRFPGEGDIRDLSYTNLSFNVRGYFPLSNGWWGYAQLGPGFYHPNYGTNNFGANAGAGLNYPVNSKLALEFGADWHVVDPGGKNRFFLDPKFGIKFRF